MAFDKNGYFFTFLFFLTFISRLHALDLLPPKIQGAVNAASRTFDAFFKMFDQCAGSRMSHMQFLVDDLQKFVNYPSKTTVGLAPKFTGNRKFFANMITTTAFKEMLAKDGEEIWNDIIKKLKYCDEVVMDQGLLKEFYDREVDQSKL